MPGFDGLHEDLHEMMKVLIQSQRQHKTKAFVSRL